MPASEGPSRLRISAEEFVFFQNQIASMCRLDVPLADGLASMAREISSRRFRTMVEQVTRDVREGLPLSKAIRKYPRVFPDLYVGLIEAGESAGNLAAVLESLGAYSTSRYRIRQRVRVALAYPGCVMLLVAVIVGLVFWWLMPKYFMLFQAVGVEMPGPTKALLGIGNFLQENGPWFLLAAALGALLVSALARVRRVRVVVELLAMNLPLVGKVFRRSAWFLFCRTLGLLLRAGVSLARSLELMKQAFAVGVLHAVCADMHRAADNGERISEEARRSGFFPETFVWKLAFGEEKGDLIPAVEELARYYESEAEVALERSGALLGPLLVCVVGLFVGFCYLGIFLPILKLQETLRKK